MSSSPQHLFHFEGGNALSAFRAQALALPGPDALPAMVKEIARPGDYVVCLGAGNITQWAYALPKELGGTAS